jgi:hypothetical protein
MGAFRMETLRHTNDWSFYREGLKKIEISSISKSNRKYLRKPK